MGQQQQQGNVSETIYQIQAAIACQWLDFQLSSKTQTQPESTVQQKEKKGKKERNEKKNYKKLLNCDWLDFVFNLFVDSVWWEGGKVATEELTELPLRKVFNQNCTGNQKSVEK